MLCYDRKNGLGHFYITDAPGHLSHLVTHKGWRKSWHSIVPGQFGGNGYTDLLFYGRQRGQGYFFATDGKGRLSRLAGHKGWRKTWDIIISGQFGGNSYSDLLFYDREKKTGEFYTTDGTGKMTRIGNRFMHHGHPSSLIVPLDQRWKCSK